MQWRRTHRSKRAGGSLYRLEEGPVRGVRLGKADEVHVGELEACEGNRMEGKPHWLLGKGGQNGRDRGGKTGRGWRGPGAAGRGLRR